MSRSALLFFVLAGCAEPTALDLAEEVISETYPGYPAGLIVEVVETHLEDGSLVLVAFNSAGVPMFAGSEAQGWTATLAYVVDVGGTCWYQ